MTATLYILATMLLGRASGGWDPAGWSPPGGRFWMRLWAVSVGLGAVLFQPVPWSLGVLVAVLAYLSRVEQTRWLETHWRLDGAAVQPIHGLKVASVHSIALTSAMLPPIGARLGRAGCRFCLLLCRK